MSQPTQQPTHLAPPMSSPSHSAAPSAPIPIPRGGTRGGEAPARRALQFEGGVPLSACESYPPAELETPPPKSMAASPATDSALPRPTPHHGFVKSHSWAGAPTAEVEEEAAPAQTQDSNGHFMAASCVFPRTVLRSTSPVFPQAFSLNANEQDSGSESPQCPTGDELESDAVNSSLAPNSAHSQCARVPESSRRKRPQEPTSAVRASGLRKMSTTLFPERAAALLGEGQMDVTENFANASAAYQHPHTVPYGRPLAISRLSHRSLSHSFEPAAREYDWETGSDAGHHHTHPQGAPTAFAAAAAAGAGGVDAAPSSRPSITKQPPGRPLRVHVRSVSCADDDAASDSELVAPTRVRAAPKPSSIARVLRNHRNSVSGRFDCKVPGCNKRYSSSGGIRYHLRTAAHEGLVHTEQSLRQLRDALEKEEVRRVRLGLDASHFMETYVKMSPEQPDASDSPSSSTGMPSRHIAKSLSDQDLSARIHALPTTGPGSTSTTLSHASLLQRDSGVDLFSSSAGNTLDVGILNSPLYTDILECLTKSPSRHTAPLTHEPHSGPSSGPVFHGANAFSPASGGLFPSPPSSRGVSLQVGTTTTAYGSVPSGHSHARGMHASQAHHHQHVSHGHGHAHAHSAAQHGLSPFAAGSHVSVHFMQGAATDSPVRTTVTIQQGGPPRAWYGAPASNASPLAQMNSLPFSPFLDIDLESFLNTIS